jgi:carbonic anhydrase
MKAFLRGAKMENEAHFTHIDKQGQARMVDVSAKQNTETNCRRIWRDYS